MGIPSMGRVPTSAAPQTPNTTAMSKYVSAFRVYATLVFLYEVLFRLIIWLIALTSFSQRPLQAMPLGNSVAQSRHRPRLQFLQTAIASIVS
jgi:hypothetical protein